jgi:hypothetical protein
MINTMFGRPIWAVASAAAVKAPRQIIESTMHGATAVIQSDRTPDRAYDIDPAATFLRGCGACVTWPSATTRASRGNWRRFGQFGEKNAPGNLQRILVKLAAHFATVEFGVVRLRVVQCHPSTQA